ncbi:RluA family pseudouridine synthase [Phototrophicus methaneseepsis]|uniref:RluA family pseudouridine synthase n=1 Tax=Phototrophicus methaneseepsis TaxID=2710758 RepID=UPI001E37402B|nr:RluA family pseudouridine synthase [Phototrophicus methaneseepsis]
MQFTVSESGERLDKIIIAQLPALSRAQVQALIKDGMVTVDGETSKPSAKLKGESLIQVTLPVVEDESIIEPESLDLDIRYEDEHIVVLNKPSGLVVHPGVGNVQGTLVNALLARYPEMIDMQDDPQAEGRMGIVHRLDKDTSGLMVVARHVEALYQLMGQFQARTVEKYYTALLERRPKTNTGTIDAPIARDPRQRKRMAVVRDGKPAVTEFELIDDNFLDGRALVCLRLHTGRTHQIRVHMAFIGCPVVGDIVYGYRKQRTGLKRQFLHASELAFDHPATGERLHFTSELPVGLQNILDKLRS